MQTTDLLFAGILLLGIGSSWTLTILGIVRRSSEEIHWSAALAWMTNAITIYTPVYAVFRHLFPLSTYTEMQNSIMQFLFLTASVQLGLALSTNLFPIKRLSFLVPLVIASVFWGSFFFPTVQGLNLLRELMLIGLFFLAISLVVWGVVSRSWDRLALAATLSFFFSYLGGFSVGRYLLLPSLVLLVVSIGFRFFAGNKPTQLS